MPFRVFRAPFSVRPADPMSSKSGVSPARKSAPAALVYTGAFIAPILVLALGHMLSNLLRTLPAISADMMARDLGMSAEGLASATGMYHFAFAAGQIPVGVALDRYGVKRVSLSLLATVLVGAAFAAIVQGPIGLVISQIVLGLSCCGMLLCPMTLAAKVLSPARFGLWSSIVQSVGNAGMLVSASPLAWLVDNVGWRPGFWLAAAFALVVLVLVTIVVPRKLPQADAARPALRDEAREVLRLGMARPLRGVMILAFASFAAVIALRGLWGGPWLMDAKGLTRMEAGNALLWFTLALTLGPLLFGVVDRRVGNRRLLIVVGHSLAALALLALAAGGPGGWLSSGLGRAMLPPSFDVTMFLLFGLAASVQPLLFAMGREAVTPDKAGKALSAINLAFFAGAAVLQSATGPIAAAWGMSAVLVFLALVLLACTALFVAYMPRRASVSR